MGNQSLWVPVVVLSLLQNCSLVEYSAHMSVSCIGERMLGGGDKGACGALVLAGAVDALRKAVDHGYPASRPAYAEHYAMHVCTIVDGVTVQQGL
jgi:galactokinase